MLPHNTLSITTPLDNLCIHPCMIRIHLVIARILRLRQGRRNVIDPEEYVHVSFGGFIGTEDSYLGDVLVPADFGFVLS
jgi:hypothetical protein